MNAYKIIQIPDSNKLEIEIPNNFINRMVEIIILSIDEDLRIPKNSLQEKLLNGPTWNDKEYQNYLEAREHLNKWSQI